MTSARPIQGELSPIRVGKYLFTIDPAIEAMVMVTHNTAIDPRSRRESLPRACLSTMTTSSEPTTSPPRRSVSAAAFVVLWLVSYVVVKGSSADVDIVGCSPEALVTVQDGKATTHPIAGTRWRGETEEEDVLLEKELLPDDKERAEHLMLVDLGRNDLGRVCVPGTVKV